MTTIARAEFEALAARAGLPLSEQQKTELHAAYGALEGLLARLRAPLPRAAEPATIFAIDKSGA